MVSASDNSSDDDEYDYCNVAARLKALSREKKNQPRPKVREVPKESPILEPKSQDIEDTRVEESVQSELEETVICGEIYDDADSVSNSLSPYPDDIIEISSVDTAPRTPLGTIEIFDSPPRPQPVNDSNIDDLEDSIIDDTTVDVHIRWKSNKIETIRLDKHEPLLKIFQKFADQENMPVNRILVSRRDVPVKRSDTPMSLKLSIIDVLEGGIINAETSNEQKSEEEEDDEDMCKIKAQVSAKKFVICKLRRDEPFKKLEEHCAKEWNVPVEKIKFSFDGDDVSASDTPDVLDLDDEACIDVKILA